MKQQKHGGLQGVDSGFDFNLFACVLCFTHFIYEHVLIL